MSRTQPKLSKIGRLRLAGEETFGTENTGDYVYFKQNGFDRSGLTGTTIRDEYQRVDHHEDAHIIGAYGGQASLMWNPFGWSSTVPSAAPSHTDPSDGGDAFDMQVGLLAALMGNAVVGGYTEDESSSTTSSISATTLDTFDDGQAFAYTDGTDYYVGWLKAISQGTPDTATVLQTLAAVPSDGKLFGSYTLFTRKGMPYIYDTTNSAAAATPPAAFCAEFLGHDSDDSTTITGGFPGNATLTFNRNELPLIEMPFLASHFSDDGSGGAPAAGTWSFPLATANLAARVCWGTTAATTLRVSSITVNLNATVVPHADINATSGVGGWSVTELRPEVTFSVYRDISEEVTDWSAQNGKAFTAQFGTQAGKMMAICIPNAYVANYPGATDEDGHVTSQITLVPGPYTGDGTAKADGTASNSEFRIAFL